MHLRMMAAASCGTSMHVAGLRRFGWRWSTTVRAAPDDLLSFCLHPLSIPIDTPTKYRGGCSRRTVWLRGRVLTMPWPPSPVGCRCGVRRQLIHERGVGQEQRGRPQVGVRSPCCCCYCCSSCCSSCCCCRLLSAAAATANAFTWTSRVLPM